MDVMIGKRLNDRYKIVKMIGGGGMANVYLARDIILERDVAVKVLRLDFSHNEEFIKRFRREAHSVTALSHPNIVNIYDIGEEEGIYYIVMEYIAGVTLKQYIQQKGHLSVQESVDVMEQLTSAMAHAHHCEIVHRDLKPQNILIAPDGTIKVTDFGIAIVTSATTITHTNSVLGSVHYLSPEQARGGLANKKSDIYSLGIVFFELLTGRPPFSGESAVAIALKHLQNETPSLKRWNDSVPQSIENIVLKATAKDPFYRYSSIDKMKEEIVTALNPERMSEPKFRVPEDVDATKAIPVIKDDMFHNHVDETIIHNTDKKPVIPEKVDAKNKEEKKNKSKKFANWKKKYTKIIISLAAVLFIMVILMFTVFPKFMFPSEVKVPDVTNMNYDKAVAELSSKGFVLNEPKQIHDEGVEEGMVIKTDPAAGANVKEKSSITIYKSLGKKKGEMSNYIGQKYEDIEDTLKSKYKEVEVSQKESDKPAGEILSQTPATGKEIVDEDTVLELVISKGPPKVKMPNVSGWTLSNLNGYAKDNKLKVASPKEEYSETVEKGVIISQSPAANAQLNPGDTISVVVSLGKKETPPKTVKETVTVKYEPSEPDKPQIVEVYIEDLNHKMNEPVEKKSITETNTVEIKLTIPYGQSASYKIVRDGEVYAEKKVQYPSD
jgi:eukaryotic-like serine/threonine-protein kinase